MKKIMFMLLGVAAAVNAFADVTAKVQLTLTAESGYTSVLRLTQSDEYGALNGNEMNMDDRKVALYVLNGATKLSLAKAADFTGANVGVMLTTADTKYTITVNSATGNKILYLNDGTTPYELTVGKSYDFPATVLAFTLDSKAAPAVPQICHIGDNLEITGYAGASWYVQVVGYEHDTFVALGEVEIKKDVEQINLKQINVDETATTYKNQYKVLMYRLVDGQKQDEKTPLVIYYEKN